MATGKRQGRRLPSVFVVERLVHKAGFQYWETQGTLEAASVSSAEHLAKKYFSGGGTKLIRVRYQTRKEKHGQEN